MIQYFNHDEKKIRSVDLKKLYKLASWWPDRKLEEIQKMLNQSIDLYRCMGKGKSNRFYKSCNRWVF